MSDLIRPKKLKKGDTIGFVSPSAGLAPFAMHRIEKAVKTLEGLGYKVKIAKNALKNNDYVSASVNERVSDLHEMFSDPEVKMIMCTIGGNHSNQLLKYIDYNLIRSNPKILIGYSDITVLHWAIQAKAELATYYGPCAMTQFGENPEVLPYTLEYFNKEVTEGDGNYEICASAVWTEEVLNWFEKKDLVRPRKMKKNIGHEWLGSGKAKGAVLGGAIPSINHLAGTEYWCDPASKILFLDIPEGIDFDKGLSISYVDSYLADLDNLGVFAAVAGIIIGRPYHYSEEENSQLKNLILKYLGNKKCPILLNANIGHTDPIATLRYGSTIEIDSDNRSLTVLD